MPNRIIPYVALRGIKHGNRFITSHDGTDPTKLANGEVAYEVIGFANTIEEAQKLLWPTKEAHDADIAAYLNKTFKDMADKGMPMSESGKNMVLDIILNTED